MIDLLNLDPVLSIPAGSTIFNAAVAGCGCMNGHGCGSGGTCRCGVLDGCGGGPEAK